MKKSSKILLSTALLATFAGGVVAPLPAVFTPQIVHALDTQPTIPDETVVTIQKLQGSEFSKVIDNTNGEEKNLSDLSTLLGTPVSGLKGVVFSAFKLPDNISEEHLTALKATKNSEQLKAKAAELKINLEEEPDLNATDDNGKTVWRVPKAKNGTYIVTEKSAPENVSNALAVPFVASFPMSATDGSGYLPNVHLYPKNVTGNVPKPGKDVGQLANNDLSYKIGDTIKFFLKGTIPTNIQDYEVYNLVDEFDSKLTPDFDSITVNYGTKPLEKDTDYTVTTDGNKVTVALTPAGIAKIAENVPLANRDQVSIDGTGEAAENTDAKPFIQVNLNAKINEKAQLVTDIENKTVIEFDNKKDGERKPVTPTPERPNESEKVKVYTGGALFKKIDVKDKDVADKSTVQGLAGAEFDLLDADKKPVTWTAELIKANQAAITEGKFVGEPAADQPIKLKSGTDGTFSISGLAYGKDLTKLQNGNVVETAQTAANRTYYLKETKAPEGYVIPTDEIPFEITKSSAKAVAATAIEGTLNGVNNNKRPAIPNTGGIGSVIFVLAGLGAMVFAAFGLKKRNKG